MVISTCCHTTCTSDSGVTVITQGTALQGRADLKGPRPVPLALGGPDAQLKAAICIVPVEGGLHPWGQLPHQVGVPLPILEGFAAVVEQHIP